MKQITIDCSRLETAQQLHEALATSLPFPHWYGHNLDALYDCLTSVSEETELVFLEFSTLPSFSRGFLRVLTDAHEDNPKLQVTFVD